MKKKISFCIKIIFFLACAALVTCTLLIFLIFKNSLPIMEGRLEIFGLSKKVDIRRDFMGIPIIEAASRTDVALALGFLHAQDRFFQMDLMRRAAAGELAEIFGSDAVEFDKQRRLHGFRNLAKKIFASLSAFEQEVLASYCLGVNQGLALLKAYPFEYYLLREKPALWNIEDSLLVGLGLFFELQDSNGSTDLMRGYMQQLLPPNVYRFLVENGSAWESTLDHSQKSILPVPQAEDFSYLRSLPSESISSREKVKDYGGSNQWAMNGNKVATGKSLLACDMHLGLSVPNIWYRAMFRYKSSGNAEVEICGATLPGMPLMIIGSNKRIAWGFTNAYIDTTDLAIMEAKLPEPLHTRMEKILVKGGQEQWIRIEESKWGPILEQTFFNQPLALVWVAHSRNCLNLKLLDLETCPSVVDALEKSQHIKIPLLNFMVADDQGNIGWTLIGSILKREGHDGTVPQNIDLFQSSLNLQDALYPTIINPACGFMSTANNRMLGDKWIGHSGFLSGIRSYQINERLSLMKNATPNEVFKVQLDDEAIFYKRWQQFLLDFLNKNSLVASQYKDFLTIISEWDGYASVDSKGYFWIRTFRDKLYSQILKRILEPCLKAYPDFNLYRMDFEEPVWLIANRQPSYLLDPQFKSWQEQFLAIIDEMLKENSLQSITWGDKHVLSIVHPLSEAMPWAKALLNMPSIPVSGDCFVPHMLSSCEGASQRMVVMPGNEESSIFQSPCGQCGHPFSPHYRDAHESWLKGEPTPFLPQNIIHKLSLFPSS